MLIKKSLQIQQLINASNTFKFSIFNICLLLIMYYIVIDKAELPWIDIITTIILLWTLIGISFIGIIINLQWFELMKMKFINLILLLFHLAILFIHIECIFHKSMCIYGKYHEVIYILTR